MDSITQAALGAAVAEAGMGGKRLGNRAPVWGLLLGTLPDLDVVVYPWLDEIGRLQWHRGLSHSILVMVLASPVLGWLISRIHTGRVTFVRAAWTVFFVLLTHVLIDVFTVYGTMIFEPFSNVRVGLNNLFIIDPMFSLPILLGTGAAVFCRPGHLRKVLNSTGLAVAAAYTLWSFGAKAIAHNHLLTSLESQGLRYSRLMSAPTPFNTILWRGLVVAPDGLWVGYYSLFDGGRPVEFERLALRDPVFESVSDDPTIRQLEWFADGFHDLRFSEAGLQFDDWRFGELRASPAPLSASNRPLPIFSWRLVADPQGRLRPVQVSPEIPRAAALGSIFRRVVDPAAWDLTAPTDRNE